MGEKVEALEERIAELEQQEEIAKLRAPIDGNDVIDYLGIPAISCDPEHADDVRALAARIREGRPGEWLILSPACSSFDQFRDFEERGDTFRRLVEAAS